MVSFSPVAGILLVERGSGDIFCKNGASGFSPVAGILLVESRREKSLLSPDLGSFSPVAGILLVESLVIYARGQVMFRFSPVAGILLVESPPAETQTDKASGRQFS